MSDKPNHTPANSISQKMAELLEQQQSVQAQQNETMNEHLQQLVRLQQENNQQISSLSKSVSQLDQRVEKSNDTLKSHRSNQLLRKMLIEVPPVVLAVLLAFGINSWWQQRRANINAEKAYRNIVNELKNNMYLMTGIVSEEEKELRSLQKEILEVENGNIDPNQNYGGYFNTLPLRDAAWQTAGLSNALSYFEDSLIMDLSWVYETARAQQEFKQLTLTLDQTQKYNEETLLPYLKVNFMLLKGHIGQTKTTLEVHRDFLEKYGEMEAEEE